MRGRWFYRGNPCFIVKWRYSLVCREHTTVLFEIFSEDFWNNIPLPVIADQTWFLQHQGKNRILEIGVNIF